MTGRSAGSTAPVVSHLEKTLGLSFSGPRRTRLLASIEAERAASRLSPEAFRGAASRPGPLFDRLVTRVTVGETYFFRDRRQCELIRTVVLPQVSASTAPRHHINMWSAGCASGEEAFTLLALADDAGLRERSFVVGSDVSRAALDRARAGEYGRSSMRSTTDAERKACFREQEGTFRVKERLRRQVTFVQRNVLDGPPRPGSFDVVLCRNLLIYLTREAVQRVAAIMAEALMDGGWLITAAGDPPLTAAGLDRVTTPFGLAYRRAVAVPAAPTGPVRGQSVEPAPGLPTSAGSAAALAAGPIRPGCRSTPRREGREAPASASASASASACVDQVRSLGNAGRLAEACVAVRGAVRAHPLDVELRYLAAALLLESGRLEEASAEAAAAVYLRPDSPAAQLLLGQVQHAAGQVDRARRSFRNASRALAATSSEMPVELAVGVPAGHLAAIVQHYLDTITAPA